jgi:hypothetical protein
LPFAPQECLRALRRMLEVGGARVWGRYGFADAFNPQTGWVSPDVIAIDVGITLAMVENLRSGFCWKYFMRAPETRRALALAGFERESPGRPFNSPVLAKAACEMRRIPATPGGRDVALVTALRAAGSNRRPGAVRRDPFAESNPVSPLPAKLGDRIPPLGERRLRTDRRPGA